MHNFRVPYVQFASFGTKIRTQGKFRELNVHFVSISTMTRTHDKFQELFSLYTHEFVFKFISNNLNFLVRPMPIYSNKGEKQRELSILS